MRYYIVDDVRSVVKILNRIVEQKNLGEVVGVSTDPTTALSEIISLNPDIVYADLLMPVMDGITLVNEVKKVRPNVHFIMISQVSNKNMVSDAYQSGVEFFIHKPINIIEVEIVTKRVMEKIQMEQLLGGIQQVFQSQGILSQATANEPSAVKKEPLKDIKYLLGLLGMLGESGTKDLLNICQYCLSHGKGYDKTTLSRYSKSIDEDTKIVKQRLRRLVKKGLTNIASMGIEDRYNEVYQSYSQIVFDFDAIKTEMDYLRGTSPTPGKANPDKFIEGLLIYHEMND